MSFAGLIRFNCCALGVSALTLVFGCNDDATPPDGDGDADIDGDSDVDVDADIDSDADGDSDVTPSTRCEPLAPPTGATTTVTPSDVGRLNSIGGALTPGDTLLFADGVYDLAGQMLHIVTEGVSIRSASGDPSAVVLDGGYETGEIILINASNVTVAEITLQRARYHPIHITPARGDVYNTRIYRVNIIDPGQQSIKINADGGSDVVDNGELACSVLRMTEAGRSMVLEITPEYACYTGGIDGNRAARGWVVRDNYFEGFYCSTGESEHAIHFWRGCRDTVVERNILVDNHRGIGFGLMNSGEARTYDDDPCPGAGYVDHYGGIIRNNFIVARSPALWASEGRMDCGICLASACGAQVLHNTVVSTEAPFTSIEWRFSSTQATVVTNNLVSHNLMERDGARAEASGNVEQGPLDVVVDVVEADLHLRPTAIVAIDRGVPVSSGICDEDIDGDPRDGAPDVGADEVR